MRLRRGVFILGSYSIQKSFSVFWILKFRELSVLVFKTIYYIRNTQSERINYELHRKYERVILIRVRMLTQLIPTLPGGHKIISVY